MKLSAVIKQVKGSIITSNGEIDIVICERTIADGEHYSELLGDTFEREDLRDTQKMNRFSVAQVMSSVKNADGEYFFTGTIDDALTQYPKELFDGLATEVIKLNPLYKAEDETEADQKKTTSNEENKNS